MAGPGMGSMTTTNKERFMERNRYTIEITGTSPLLVRDWGDPDQYDAASKARTDSDRRDDERYPGWLWLAELHFRNGVASLPENALGAATWHATQSLFRTPEDRPGRMVSESAAIETPTGCFRSEVLEEAKTLGDFMAVREMVARQPGCPEPDVRRARVGTRCLVRATPKFPNWKAVVTLVVDVRPPDRTTLEAILAHAGEHIGIGSWAHSGYGRFTAKVL